MTMGDIMRKCILKNNKILVCLLIFAMAFSIIGCGKKEENSDASASQQESAIEETNETSTPDTLEQEYIRLFNEVQTLKQKENLLRKFDFYLDMATINDADVPESQPSFEDKLFGSKTSGENKSAEDGDNADVITDIKAYFIMLDEITSDVVPELPSEEEMVSEIEKLSIEKDNLSKSVDEMMETVEKYREIYCH